MRNTSLLISLLLSACTTLGFDEGGLGGSGSGSGSGDCDRTGSGLACSVDTDCASDEECEDGVCKLHGSVCDGDGDDDGGAGDDDDLDGGTDDPQGTECVLDADCTGGLECEDGFCIPHGGGH